MNKVLDLAKVGLGKAVRVAKDGYSIFDSALDAVALAIVRRAMNVQKPAVQSVVYKGKPTVKGLIPIELAGTFLLERKTVIFNLKPTDRLWMEMCPNNTHSKNAVGVFVGQYVFAQIGWIPEKNGLAKKYFYFLKMGKNIEIVNWFPGRDGEHFMIYVK